MLLKQSSHSEYFSKTLELNTEFKEAWYNKGFALDKIGRYEEALECYDKTLELCPDDGEAWFNKCELLDKLGKYREAVECYDNVLGLNPEDDKAIKNRELTKKKLDEQEKVKVNLAPAYSPIPNSNKSQCPGKKKEIRATYHIKPFHGYQICPVCGGEVEYAGISAGHIIFPGVSTAQIYICKECDYQGSAIIEVDTPEEVKKMREYLKSHKEENVAPADSVVAPAFGYPKEYMWLWRTLLILIVIGLPSASTAVTNNVAIGFPNNIALVINVWSWIVIIAITISVVMYRMIFRGASAK
jgi:tetratricopeptide (TPR) repeat protein